METQSGFSLDGILERLRPVLRTLWHHRFRIIGINAVVAVLATAYLFLFVKLSFESSITILPDYGSKSFMSGLGELASIAGMNLGTKPTDIYQDILFSEAVLTPVIRAKYKTDAYPDSVDLIQYFGIEPDESDPPGRRERRMFLTMYRTFSKYSMKTTVNNVTGILELKVTMPESQLSASVVNGIVESLDRYMRTKRRSNALNQRFYIEKRLEQVKDSLHDAEENLRKFREQNRTIGASPSLTLQESRLSRAVQIFQALFLQLNQQMEMAKIEEIRDTPVLNVKEMAQDPIIKSGPKRLMILVVLLMISLIVTSAYYVYAEIIRTFVADTMRYLRSI